MFAAILANAAPKTVTVTEGTNIAATVSPDQKTIVDRPAGLAVVASLSRAEPRSTHRSADRTRASRLLAEGRPHRVSGLQGRHVSHLDDEAGRHRPESAHRRTRRRSRAALFARRHEDRVRIRPRLQGQLRYLGRRLATGKLTQWTSAPSRTNTSRHGRPTARRSRSSAAPASMAPPFRPSTRTGKLRTLATAPTGARLNSPSWSPDGKLAYIAVSRQQKPPDGLRQVRLGTVDDVFPFPATWLPGGRILYTATARSSVTSSRWRRRARHPV